MNATSFLRRVRCLAGLLILTNLSTGCGPKSVPPSPETVQTPPPARAPASAEKTSFAEVTSQLDPGGCAYAYLSTSQWLDGLSKKLDPWRALLLGLPGMGSSDREQLERVLSFVDGLIKQSGVEALSGVGFSGIALEPGFYRSKLVAHHYSGSGAGYLWNLFGSQAHAVDLPDWLPVNTVWASSSDIDLAGIWKAIRDHAQQMGVPEAIRGLDQFEGAVQQASGMKWDEVLGSLGGNVAFALTLDPAKKISIPLPEGDPLSLPQPGLVIGLKVKDDRIYDWVQKVAGPQLDKVEVPGGDSAAKVVALKQPLPLPFPLRPTLGRSGDYLWLASHDELLLAMVQIKAGKTAGLRSSAEFKKLMAGLPDKGNHFAFASDGLQEIAKAFQTAMQSAARRGDGPPQALLDKLFASGGRTGAASVSSVGPTGWVSVGHGYQSPAGAVMLPAVVAPTAIMAGMALPALAKAKSKAQSINCVNNLKQLGLGARIYATDHNDQMPPDILSMKQELVNPKMLFCPMDPAAGSRKDVTWDSLQKDSISYEYLGAGKMDGSNPQAVMFKCRFHGHVCHMDGSVQMSGRP